jgi:glycosyltransferase involved in cell wall biosynthesis
MIILENSTYDARSIGWNLGAPEYSYWFVRKAFHPILQRFGIVVPIADPANDVDGICRNAAAQGERCAYFSFNPPHRATLGLKCPTVPVFAWEFDTIPDEEWGEEPRNDWTAVLRQSAAAITHSQFSVRAVRRSLGDAYPIWSIPAPVHRPNAKRTRSALGWRPPTRLSITGLVIDAGAVDLSVFDVQRAKSDGAEALHRLGTKLFQRNQKPFRVSVNGVIYTAVFNPVDGRKNWTDMLAGFIWAFRDAPDATLLLKLTHHDVVLGMLPILAEITKLGPFKCRVLLIHGMLPAQEYDALVDATSYAVNTSSGEGQCLPLMEFMSAGRPAVTPSHTAMLEYVSSDNSFLVRSTEKPAVWPQDPRHAIRCMRHVLSFADLVRAYKESFEVARHRPRQYAAMSAAATTALERFCSDEVVASRLRDVLRHLGMPAAFGPALASDANIGAPDGDSRTALGEVAS